VNLTTPPTSAEVEGNVTVPVLLFALVAWTEKSCVITYVGSKCRDSKRLLPDYKFEGFRVDELG